jgi:hypothetical protein
MTRKEDHRDLIHDHDADPGVDIGHLDLPIEPAADVKTSGPSAERAQDDAPRGPIEVWAERKGLLPQFTSSNRANPEYFKFAAAKGLRGWTDGQVVTEAEFDEAVKQQGEQAIR